MKQGLRRFLEQRIYVLTAVLLAMFVILVRRFFDLQILNGVQYRKTFQTQVERQEIYPGSRGVFMTEMVRNWPIMNCLTI